MFRKNSNLRKTIASAMTVAFMLVGVVPVANAGVIGAQATVNEQQRVAQQDRVEAFLSKAEVREQFAKMGVDADVATERLSTLTTAELAQLEQQIQDATAGSGVLAVIGIVFVVLLVLELTGVIDIFKRT